MDQTKDLAMFAIKPDIVITDRTKITNFEVIFTDKEGKKITNNDLDTKIRAVQRNNEGLQELSFFSEFDNDDFLINDDIIFSIPTNLVNNISKITFEFNFVDFDETPFNIHVSFNVKLNADKYKNVFVIDFSVFWGEINDKKEFYTFFSGIKEDLSFKWVEDKDNANDNTFAIITDGVIEADGTATN